MDKFLDHQYIVRLITCGVIGLCIRMLDIYNHFDDPYILHFVPCSHAIDLCIILLE